MEKICFYCGAITSQRIKLQEHHVFGKVNSDMWVYACLNCHNPMTLTQNSVNPFYRSKNASPTIRFHYSGLSLGTHLKKLSEEIIKQELEFFGDGDSLPKSISGKGKSKEK